MSVSVHPLRAQGVFATYGYFVVEEVRDALGVPAVAHVESQRYLADTCLNLSARHGLDVRVHDVGPLVRGAPARTDWDLRPGICQDKHRRLGSRREPGRPVAPQDRVAVVGTRP